MRIKSELQGQSVSYFAEFASELDRISRRAAEIITAKERGRGGEYRGLRAREGEVLRALASGKAADEAALRRKALACLVPTSIEHSGLAMEALQSLALDVLSIVKVSAEAAEAGHNLASERSTHRTQLLDVKAVAAMLGVSRVTVYNWMRERGFPCPLAISEKCVRWRLDEVTAWINALPRSSVAEVQA